MKKRIRKVEEPPFRKVINIAPQLRTENMMGKKTQNNTSIDDERKSRIRKNKIYLQNFIHISISPSHYFFLAESIAIHYAI